MAVDGDGRGRRPRRRSRPRSTTPTAGTRPHRITRHQALATDATAGDEFGSSVAVRGDAVVVGAVGDDDTGGSQLGSAYAFRTTDGGVTFEEIKITSDDDDAGRRGRRCGCGLRLQTLSGTGAGARPRADAAAHARRRPRWRCRAGGGNSANNAGLGVGALVSIVVVATLLLCAVAGTLTYRRERARRLHKEEDLEAGKGDALARQRDVSECVATGMSLVNTLLTVGSLVPFVGDIAEVANEFFGSASEFGDRADDVAMAARRVTEVLGMVHLIAKNIENLEDGKDLVSQKMERLVSLLTKFHGAVRKFGDKAG